MSGFQCTPVERRPTGGNVIGDLTVRDFIFITTLCTLIKAKPERHYTIHLDSAMRCADTYVYEAKSSHELPPKKEVTS